MSILEYPEEPNKQDLSQREPIRKTLYIEDIDETTYVDLCMQFPNKSELAVLYLRPADFDLSNKLYNLNSKTTYKFEKTNPLDLQKSLVDRLDQYQKMSDDWIVGDVGDLLLKDRFYFLDKGVIVMCYSGIDHVKIRKELDEMTM